MRATSHATAKTAFMIFEVTTLWASANGKRRRQDLPLLQLGEAENTKAWTQRAGVCRFDEDGAASRRGDRYLVASTALLESGASERHTVESRLIMRIVGAGKRHLETAGAA